MRYNILHWTSFVCCLLVSFSWATTNAFAQSAEDPDDPADVIDAFIEALGGEMVLGSIETLSVKVKYEGWTDGSADFYFKKGQRLDLTTLSGRSGYDDLYDGENWYLRSPSSNYKVAATKNQLLTKQAAFDMPTDALQLRKQVSDLEIVSRDEFEDHPYSDCVCLRLKDSKGGNIYRYFNPETGLLECIERWTENKDGSLKMGIRYFEFQYKEVDGLMFLETSRRTTGADSFLDVVYNDFVVDQPVDDALFDFDIDDD